MTTATTTKKSRWRDPLDYVEKATGVRPRQCGDLLPDCRTYMATVGDRTLVFAVVDGPGGRRVRKCQVASVFVPALGFEVYNAPNLHQAVKLVAERRLPDAGTPEEKAALPPGTSVTVTLGFRPGNGLRRAGIVEVYRHNLVRDASRLANGLVRAQVDTAAAANMVGQYLDGDLPLPILLDWFMEHSPELCALMARPSAGERGAP